VLLTGPAPTVSIAIRAYRRRWLSEAIASVLAQTYRDLELVVYDDAGDLEAVVAGFADPRLRYHRAEHSFEASGRFTAAVSLCRGRYVGVLDDDDRYEPEFVAQLVGALEDDPEAGIAFCRDVWEVDGTLHDASNGMPSGRQPDSVRALVSRRWQVQPSRMVIRRSALNDAERIQPMPDGVSPDVFVNVRTALAGWHHVFVDERLVVCRWHPQQLSRIGRGGYDRSISTTEALRVPGAELELLRGRRLAGLLVARGMFELRSGNRGAARADFRAAREADPATSRRARRVGAAVAALPGAGVAVRHAHALKRRVHRRDALPPGVGGSGARQVARDAAALAVGSGAAQALTILAAPILTRLYDPAEIGAAAVLTGVMGVCSVIACLRFDLAIPLSRGARATAEVCALCLVAGAAFAAVLGVVAVLFGQSLCDVVGVPQVGRYAWLVPVDAAVASVGLIGAGLLVRRRRYGKLASTRVSQTTGQSGTQVAAGAMGGGAGWFAGGVVAGAAAFSLVAATAARREFTERPLRAYAAEGLSGIGAAARRWRGYAAWACGAGVLQGASAALPAILVAALYGPAPAGLFVLAQRVVGLPVAFAADAVGSAWFGTAAEIVRERRGKLSEPLATITRTLLLWGGAVLVLIVVAAPLLFGPVFGDQWDGAGEIVLVLAPLWLSIFAAAPAGLTLQALGRTDLLTAVAAGRLVTPIAGVAGGHALGWSLTASLGLYAAGMIAMSAVNATLAWRLSSRAPAQ
jgi:O-antigen/teichoic acid export membrane protein